MTDTDAISLILEAIEGGKLDWDYGTVTHAVVEHIEVQEGGASVQVEFETEQEDEHGDIQPQSTLLEFWITIPEKEVQW